MKNKLIILSGAFIGFVAGYIILSNSYNIIGKAPLSILAMIYFRISSIFLGPCPENYGDFPCEDRLIYVIPFVLLFPFVCSLIGALIGFIIGRKKNL